MARTKPTTNCHVQLDDTPAWPAHDNGQRWNGWVCPSFDKATAALIVDWINAENAAGPAPEDQDYLHWDGNTVVITNDQWPDDPTYCTPDKHGRIHIGSWSWCWWRPDETTEA